MNIYYGQMVICISIFDNSKKCIYPAVSGESLCRFCIFKRNTTTRISSKLLHYIDMINNNGMYISHTILPGTTVFKRQNDSLIFVEFYTDIDADIKHIKRPLCDHEDEILRCAGFIA